MKPPCHRSIPFRSKLKILIPVLSINLLSIFFFSGFGGKDWFPIIAGRGDFIRELIATQGKLLDSRAELAQLQKRFSNTSGLLELLLGQLGRRHGDRSEDLDGWADEMVGELKLAAGTHKLPLGYNANLDADELFPTMGFACRRFREEVAQYMAYEPGTECPSDAVFSQRLMRKGCEPLPRRRCRPPSPKGYVEPADTSVVRNAYACKNYSCPVSRGQRGEAAADCNDCFDLEVRENRRWVADGPGLDFGMDAVLAARPRGTVRIGLDIGGGSGTFSARMRERGVTVVSTTADSDVPLNSFIADQGLVAVHVSVAHRLPFYDHTLDIVHSMLVLGDWLPSPVMEAALYDIYRVLRPGGLFWLDHFFCRGEQLNATYVPMIQSIGFNKLRWVAARKLDRGPEKNEWYLSALLEKPIT